MIAEDVLFSGIREIGAQLRARRFSAVELAELALRRLETIGPKLGAVVTPDAGARACAEAHRANQELFAGKDRGPLHGIPYGVKDLLATKGIADELGCRSRCASRCFDYDATVVARLEEAGAVLVAKLAMVELAGGMGYNSPDASFTGPGRTPWNTDYWSGGSSSGSAAAVAAGLVPFAIGSETSGSILTPAAFCGVDRAAARATGSSRATGRWPSRWTLDKLGPLARSVDDCAIVLAAIAGPDPRDPTTTGDSFRHKSAPARAAPRGASAWASCATPASAPSPTSSRASRGRRTRSATWRTSTRTCRSPTCPTRDAVRLIVAAEGAAALRELVESGRVKQLQDRADRVRGFARLVDAGRRTTSTRCGRGSRCAPSSTRCCRATTRSSHPRARGSPRPIGQDFDAPTPGSPPQPAPRPAHRGRSPRSRPATWRGCRRSRCRWASGRDGLPTSLQLLGPRLLRGDARGARRRRTSR